MSPFEQSRQRPSTKNLQLELQQKIFLQAEGLNTIGHHTFHIFISKTIKKTPKVRTTHNFFPPFCKFLLLTWANSKRVTVSESESKTELNRLTSVTGSGQGDQQLYWRE